MHHALHYYTGAFDIWIGIGGAAFARRMSETVAHQWSYQFGTRIGSEVSRNVVQFNRYNSGLLDIHKLKLR